MLLEFRVKNYKSFADDMVFSMKPAPKQKGLDYSVITKKLGNKLYKGLCSAVIYGPNAAGKTNIIGAIETFKHIVLRGNIKNLDTFVSPNAATSKLELISNCNNNDEVVSFYMSFVEDSFFIEYSVKAELGLFLDKDYGRRINEEVLRINNRLVFSRTSSDLEVFLPPSIKDYINKSIKRKTPKMLELAKDSLVDTDLFLCNGFKSIYAQDLVAVILSWFSEKLLVIYHSDDMVTRSNIIDADPNTVYVETTISKAAKRFGITGNDLGYVASNNKESEEAELCSIFKDKTIPADIFESYGTIRFINEFPLVVDALYNGGTLVMDEFDASIHPMALMNIINIFHNDDINKNHAQLIFNTHNPIFLDSSLFRRDEIKFVERDDETCNSVHYSLSDFKTADGIRKGENYMNNYFVNRYGAIKDIDFSDILSEVISDKEVTDNV